MSDTISTPCVRNCCLNDKDVCLGCGRTLQEITGWRAMTEAQRQAIMRREEENRLLAKA